MANSSLPVGQQINVSQTGHPYPEITTVSELSPTTWANRAVGAPAGTRQELDGVLYRSDGVDFDQMSNSSPSKKLLACIPGRDVSTAFKDISGNTADMTVDAGNTGAFATEGYFSTVAAVNGGLTVPAAKINWNPSTESIVFSVALKRAAPVGNETIFGVGAPTAGRQGFYISHRATTGKIRIVPIKNDGTLVSTLSDSALAFSDATPRDRVLTVAYDAPSGSFYLWRDGVLSDTYTGVMSTLYANLISTAWLAVGNTSSTGQTSVAVAGYGLQIAKYAGALPLTIGLIVARLAETPRIPISQLEW
jgi:hypothetical protein